MFSNMFAVFVSKFTNMFTMFTNKFVKHVREQVRREFSPLDFDPLSIYQVPKKSMSDGGVCSLVSKSSL